MNFSTEKIIYDDGNKGVQLIIETKVGNRYYNIKFQNECASEMERDFLIDAIQSQFEKHIEKIRDAAYQAGWKDKSSKQKKCTWFGWCPNTINPF